jgi:hypothetical protein
MVVCEAMTAKEKAARRRPFPIELALASGDQAVRLVRPPQGREAEATKAREKHDPSRCFRHAGSHIGEDELVVVVVIVAADASIFKAHISADRNSKNGPAVRSRVSMVEAVRVSRGVAEPVTPVVKSRMKNSIVSPRLTDPRLNASPTVLVWLFRSNIPVGTPLTNIETSSVSPASDAKK